MPEKLKGLFAPTLVPLDARGQIHEAELRRYISWLIEKGVHGLYPNGSSGEFTRFTEEERRRIMRITSDETHGRVPILAGAAEANVKETLAACEAYAEMGARAVAIVSPIYYRLSAESLYAYFAEIARHTPIDVTLYNIPMFATPIDLATIRRLAEECPRIVGIKDSSGDLAFMMRMIAAIRPGRPDFSFLTGWDAVLAPMLIAGCDGGTNATTDAVPEVTLRIYDLCRAAKYDEAIALNYRILDIFDTMLYALEFPGGFRTATELRGFNFGAGRVPQTDAQVKHREEIRAKLERLLAELGIEQAASRA